ncbi:HNH endonuclease [Bacillus sp. 1021]|uniref:HNH endonuclease n=1 Tax=Bacillus TaxID=1386 RepID=UPI00165F0165|nr:MULTISPECIES: HNH endonuclease [Bacillus]MBD0405721.1 HNH endonuclease [Bacillus sp. 1021]MED0772532.1 HNH endonuclease [Bacillus siamensis]MED0776333.1 HNH endonuclease [Bacillus siamensis]MED0778286.1 HNH endonuclease [Bacillus siamensis]MED0835143.1 HNH endonuclease [Bacillus siamensis]
MADSAEGTCELCGRRHVRLTEHHLTPKEEGGTFLPTAMLCIPCHKQIHALYTNRELAARLAGIEELRHDPKLARFVKWIRKQPPEKLVKTKKAKERKKR